MFLPDKVLQGALDIHAHGSPEFSLKREPRVTNQEWAKLAYQSKMRGFVIKSHIWPTTGVALELGEMLPELEIYGSITINPLIGGFNPTAIEMAAHMGAKVVWMPTWSAKNDTQKHSITIDRIKGLIETFDFAGSTSDEALSVLDEKENIRKEVLSVLNVCRKYGLSVASGHIPISHSVKLAKACAETGVKFILTHANSASVSAEIVDQKRIVELGGFIEHVMVGTMPMHGRGDLTKVVESVNEIGAEHCVLSSDAGESWNPPAPELLRMFISSLLSLGLSEDEVYVMTHDNPASAIGVAKEWNPYE